jgi:hypothetical protein
MPDGADYAVHWKAQPGPQSALLACPVFEVFYGGARGGGKTDGVLGEFVSHADLYGGNAIGLMVRRTLKQLRETIARSKQIYRPLGAIFNETDKEWTFPNGARLVFAYLERDDDADNYQGHSYTRVYIEEIGNFPNPAPIMKLMATLRSGAGVPCCFRATGNPGGPGHQWVKARYIDPAPLGGKVIRSEFTNPFTGETVTRERVYIPSRVTDNTYLGTDYIANLHLSGSENLVKAWLEGDWNVIAGAFFPEFGARHIIKPFHIPQTWARFRSGDWGSARPFSFGWWAISDGSMPEYPRGAIIRYREWYGIKTAADGTYEPNVGLRMIAEKVGEGLADRQEHNEPVKYGVLDPAAFAEDGGPSIAERIFLGSGKRIAFTRADNKRVPRNGAMGGWDQVRSRLVGDGERPMLFMFETCIHSIRTFPALQHDSDNPEDVDTEGEDHAPDDIRYGCMSRPYIAPQKEPVRSKAEVYIGQPDGTITSNLTFREMVARKTKRRLEAQ